MVKESNLGNTPLISSKKLVKHQVSEALAIPHIYADLIQHKGLFKYYITYFWMILDTNPSTVTVLCYKFVTIFYFLMLEIYYRGCVGVQNYLKICYVISKQPIILYFICIYLRYCHSSQTCGFTSFEKLEFFEKNNFRKLLTFF